MGMRGYLSRKEFKKLQEQRVALIVVQRNLRKYLQLRTWPWYRLWQKVKPLLNVSRVEDEIRALEEKAAKAQEDFNANQNLERTSKTRMLLCCKKRTTFYSHLNQRKEMYPTFWTNNLNYRAKKQI